MYIAQAFNVLHDWWRYVLGMLLIILTVIIGQIPLTVAIFFKAFSEGDSIIGMDEAQLLSILEPNLNLFLMLLSFAVGLVGVFLAVKFFHKQTTVSITTSRPKIDWSRIWFAFIFWGIISSGFIALDYYMTPEDYVYNFKLMPFLILCLIAVIFVPLQTSFEEYLFRGYLMQGIGVSSTHKKFPFVFMYIVIAILGYFLLKYSFEFGIIFKWAYFILGASLLILVTNLDSLEDLISVDPRNNIYKFFNRNSTSLIITSLVFGLLHIANPEIEQLGYVLMVYYIGTGLFLGIVTLMDEGMELALGFHAANNLFTALLVTADWTAFQTHSILKDISEPETAGFFDVFMPVFIVFPIVLFIFARKYKWTNWKDKLFGRVIEPPKEDYKILE